ncbi:MAG TPA: M23 family metallopeptidase [Caulobacteraceae bacterium]|nr:M23 family metallopeptidase [Caulobacteraceae bacterium]
MAFAATIHARLTQIATAVATIAASTGLLVEASAQVRADGPRFISRVTTAVASAPLVAPKPVVLRWEGKDVDGDGAEDFVNPTGGSMRAVDAFGHGHFGASRDGGSRHHKGVDYRAEAGQPVKAPISGYVTRIGTAYSSSPEYRYIEITNPALRYEARVFYVDPDVRVGETVRLGDIIGTVRSLKLKYGDGMTDHVHLEIKTPGGRNIDATEVLTAHVETARG